MQTRPLNYQSYSNMKTFRIGRASDSDILCTQLEVSNNHADLIEENGSYTLVDHSRNGTFVNGSRIHNSSCRVHYGDAILFAGKERLNWNLVTKSRVGTVPSSGNYGGSTYNQKIAPFSVASMVCGISSLVLSVSTIVALVLAIVGLALGVSGTRKIIGQEQLYKGIGMLRAGKICSIISLAINGIVIVFCIILFGAIGLTLFSYL